MKWIISLLFIYSNVYGFDLRDYDATYRATADAYRKAMIDFEKAEKEYYQLYNFSKQKIPMIATTELRIGEAIKVCLESTEELCAKMRTKEFATNVMENSFNSIMASEFASPATLADFTNTLDRYYVRSNTNSSVDHSLGQIAVYQNYEPIKEGVRMCTYGINDMDSQDPAYANPADYVEDLYTVYRMKRDAYIKATGEVNLARGPYEAAKAAFAQALETYLKNVDCANQYRFKYSER